MEGRTTIYMDTFNKYNGLQQELTFLEQKYAYFLNQRDIKNNKDSEWFEAFQNQLEEYWINTNREKIRRDGLMETLSQLDEGKIIDILNTFFWIENDKISEEKWEILNNILLSDFLSDINHYKEVKRDMKEIMWDEDKKAIINRMWKIVKQDLMATLKNDKSLQDFSEWSNLKYTSERRFSRFRRRWAKDIKELERDTIREFHSEELHEKFTTSILTFHEIEKLYQKYNYVFTMRDMKDTHTILRALRKWEMVLMTWDTWSWKTELGLLIANIYLDEIYKDNKERNEKKPILVTGNSDTDFSDLTVEKIITSKNAVTDQNDAILWTENERTNTQDVLNHLLKSDDIKRDILEVIENERWITSDKKDKLKRDLENYDMFKYNIFTEFHLQWIVKAMENWVPLILDEINGIPPEVLLWLNHYFTRKVGEEINIWNWFKPIRIKKWFCIICTGNDKDENSKIARYQGRFGIDESLLNRMHRVCKWYYNQTTDSKDFDNRNSQIEGQAEKQQSQLEYMNENELYGVILMLCFYDEDKANRTKKLGKTRKIDEISNDTLLKKMINTETVWFNLMKESFKKSSNREAIKEKIFTELKSLAKFIHYVQGAYQWNGIMIGKDKLELNKSPFSMRQLVSIIRDWKGDTKSLWSHLYNKYTREIPVNNDDRYTIYRIAQEVWFIEKKLHIDRSSDSIQEITEILERNNNEEYHSWAHTRDAHIEAIDLDENILENNIIITKQDVYKEYFGENFWNVDDSEFVQQIEAEKEEQMKSEWTEIQEENIEDIRERVATTLDNISEFLDRSNNAYVKQIDFKTYRTLKQFCEKEWENYVYLMQWSKDSVKEAEQILWKILENFQDGEDTEWLSNLVQELKGIN